jgi:hypothetical protein
MFINSKINESNGHNLPRIQKAVKEGKISEDSSCDNPNRSLREKKFNYCGVSLIIFLRTI